MLTRIYMKLSPHIMPLKGIFSFPNISNANLTYEQSPETEVTLGSLTVTL